VAKYRLRLYDDRFGAKASPADALPAANRVIYVTEGMATLAASGAAATLSANSAWFSAAGARVTAGSDGARMLRYELVGNDAATGAIAADTVASELVLESTVELEPGENYLMRCDRVDIPPGGIAYTHTHQGPGTRYLLQGGFMVETQGHKTSVAPGEAWFETGPDPVLAWAPNDRPGYFSRVMILPRALRGKSSIRYMKAEDADKPKLQRYTIFIDEFITL
jgi:quercetin dioxygenase-like cupin family protein